MKLFDLRSVLLVVLSGTRGISTLLVTLLSDLLSRYRFRFIISSLIIVQLFVITHASIMNLCAGDHF